MTPEQEQMFHLTNTSTPTPLPGQVVQVDHQMMEAEGDPVGEGLARSMSYMAANGPTRPTQRGPAKVMTKAQLEDQKMRERQGLPSNEDESARVVNLENQVAQISENIQRMAGIMSQMVAGQPQTPPLNAQGTQPPELSYDPGQRSALTGELLPTPPERRAVVPQPREQSPPSLERNIQQLAHPEPPMVPTTTAPVAPTSPPVTSTPQPQQAVSPVTIGPVGSQSPEGLESTRFDLTETEPFPGDVSTLIESEPDVTKEDKAEKLRLERQQILTDQVFNWLKEKDSHKFWRQFLSGSCNKNLSYNTWPKEMQDGFNGRFTTMIKDPIFVATLCGQILKMQNGHMVSCNIAGAFIVATAGFLSFALLEA